MGRDAAAKMGDIQALSKGVQKSIDSRTKVARKSK
jgi:hypothetical protein